MKRIISVVLVAGLAIGVGARQAFAQDKKIEFSLNAGALTESFEEVWATISPQLDFHVTKGFTISTEVMCTSDFYNVVLLPGVLLNYTGRGLFAGAGVVLPVYITGGLEAGNLLLKLNAGYRFGHFHLTAYVITDTSAMFSENIFGAGIGYRF